MNVNEDEFRRGNAELLARLEKLPLEERVILMRKWATGNGKRALGILRSKSMPPTGKCSSYTTKK